MGWVSGIVVYLLVWWTVLFTVLPWGVRQPDDAEKTNAGPPKNPNIRKKFVVTTLVSAVIWLIIAYLIDIKIVDFRQMAKAGPYGL